VTRPFTADRLSDWIPHTLARSLTRLQIACKTWFTAIDTVIHVGISAIRDLVP